MLTKVGTLSIFKDSVVEDLCEVNDITIDSMTKEIFLWVLFCSYNTQVFSCAVTSGSLWLQWRKWKIRAIRIFCYAFRCSFPKILRRFLGQNHSGLFVLFNLTFPSSFPDSVIMWQQSTSIFTYAFSMPHCFCCLNPKAACLIPEYRWNSLSYDIPSFLKYCWNK